MTKEPDPSRYEPELPPLENRLDLPSWARLNNYYLSGGNYWAVDRDFAEDLLDIFPMERATALRHRLFLHRAVRYMAGRGIRQFVDIGSGAPESLATHAVADVWSREQDHAPDINVCYVDHDSIAIAQGELNLAKADPRRHIMLEADLRKPDMLWDQLLDRGVIDSAQPLGVLHGSYHAA